MIVERPGASNDRDYVLGNIDNDRLRDEHFKREQFEKSYDAISSFVPWYEKKVDND